MNYFITFGQKDRERKDGWVRLSNAQTLEQAKNFADQTFDSYSMIYEEFDFIEGYFPKGLLAEYDLKNV